METNSQARTDWQSQQHPQIKQRYSTKHLLQIFKSLGRFQNPLETPETYQLSEDDCSFLKPLVNVKPNVVLQHLRTAGALPLMLGQDQLIKSRILDDATVQLQNRSTRPY